MTTDFENRDWWALWKKTSKKWNDYFFWYLKYQNWLYDYKIVSFDIDDDTWFPNNLLIWDKEFDLKDLGKVEKWEKKATKDWVEYRYFEYTMENWEEVALRLFKNEKYVEWWKIPLINILVTKSSIDVNKNKEKKQEKLFNEINDVLEKEKIENKEIIWKDEEEDLDEIF